MDDSVLFHVLNYSTIILQLFLILQLFGEVDVLSMRPECWSKLWLAEVSNFPMEFTGHGAALIHAAKLRYLRVHLTRMLYHLLH
jgi:hypothetical protein